jgi:membrane associated rhomboid family serine protease
MVFLFPYGTNAPIYHRPITTVVLIAINCAAFCVRLAAPEQIMPYILVFGHGMHPVQWITSCFLHASVLHLLGNMLFLWLFGLIVEGKLGWYKTLAVYLGIAAIHGAIVQYLMLGPNPSAPGALGASAAIFGFMAMCLVWAPENEINCFIMVTYFIIKIAWFEVKVVVMVGLFLLLQLVIAIFTSMAMSSEVLHLIGAAVGFPFAIAMLKLGVVDCEHWDAFSVWSGRHLMTDEEREEADANSPARRREEQRERDGMRAAALQQIHEIIASGDAPLALKAHQRMSSELSDWVLPQSDMLALIQRLHDRRLWADSVPLMGEYLSRYPENSALVRLKLAQIFVAVLHHPAKALKVMAKIDDAALDARHHEFLRQLRVKAAEYHERDPYEVADQDC